MKSKWKTIIIDDILYEYTVSLKTNNIIIYTGDKRHVVSMTEQLCKTVIDPNYNNWRGKKFHGSFGKSELSKVIRMFLPQ